MKKVMDGRTRQWNVTITNDWEKEWDEWVGFAF